MRLSIKPSFGDAGEAMREGPLDEARKGVSHEARKDRSDEAREGVSDEARSLSVELQIDELVLHGFSHLDRYRIGESLERELSRLFLEFGVPAALLSGVEMPNLDSGSFNIRQTTRPETIGAQVAAAVYEGMKRC